MNRFDNAITNIENKLKEYDEKIVLTKEELES